jgi:hypothetical protein
MSSQTFQYGGRINNRTALWLVGALMAKYVPTFGNGTKSPFSELQCLDTLDAWRKLGKKWVVLDT